MSICALVDAIKEKNNPTVVGLDPKLSYIPKFIKDASFEAHGKTLEGAADAIFTFNKGLIDALCDIVPAVKPQSAYYEMYGLPGIVALDKTIKYAKEKGLYVILDVKRNDIGSTAEAYSAAYLGTTDIEGEKVRAFCPDSVTVNPYLGTDGIAPFVADAKAYGKSIFVLVKTSNPSSKELQDCTLTKDGAPLYESVARMLEQLNRETLVSGCEYGEIGAVVGATHPDDAKKLRKIMPSSYFLVPGYGAQGGSAKDVVPCFNNDGLGAIVNSSRKIMCAYQAQKCDEKDFAAAAKEEALSMKKDILDALS